METTHGNFQTSILPKTALNGYELNRFNILHRDSDYLSTTAGGKILQSSAFKTLLGPTNLKRDLSIKYPSKCRTEHHEDP